MTVLEQDTKLATTFQAICDHIAHADPNDFDSQIPPSFVSCDAEQKTVVCSFQVPETFGNPHGMMHGGIIAAMIDCAQGSTISSICGTDTRIVTVSLQISYIQPVFTGRPLFVRVRIQQIGGRITYCSAEAWQQEGKITTTTSGVYHILRGGKK